MTNADQPLEGLDIRREITESLIMHRNVSQEIVITTIDKLHLCLLEHRDCLASRKEWIAPAGLTASLLTTMIATDFKQFVFAPATWFAIYFLGLLASAVWTAVLAARAFRNRREGGVPGLIDKITKRSASPAFAAFGPQVREALRNAIAGYADHPPGEVDTH